MSEASWHQACHEHLQNWVASGLDQCDPVRVLHIQRLLARAVSQPASVQAILAARVQQEIQVYEQRWQVTGARSIQATSVAGQPRVSPLAELTEYLGAQNHHEPTPSLAGDESVASDMKSVRRFGQVWSHIAAEQQVKQALNRGPENAGPLNAHRLMLRSLALMQSLSPDYLRRFLGQADALLWVEQANQKNALGDTRDKSKKVKVSKKA